MIDPSTFIGPGVAGLILLAFVNTMPEELPYCWRDYPRWIYHWLRDGLKTFTSMRGPKA